MNHYRQLLVHLDASTRNVPRLRAARTIAQEHGAALTACYAVTSSYLDAAYGLEMAPALVETLAQIDAERRERARKAFDIELLEPGPTVAWSELSGIGTVGEFARQGFYADLLVLGQHDESNPDGTPPDFNEAVILGSGKPALVIPYTGWAGAIGQRVMIAWKETPQAARAVAAALPLLQRARSVHVVEWDTQPETTVKGKALDLRSYLRLHQVEADWSSRGDEPEQVGEMALSAASDLDADLLVMGCYGHSRVRELVLGGMSRTVLRSMTLPVLMAH